MKCSKIATDEAILSHEEMLRKTTLTISITSVRTVIGPNLGRARQVKPRKLASPDPRYER